MLQDDYQAELWQAGKLLMATKHCFRYQADYQADRMMDGKMVDGQPCGTLIRLIANGKVLARTVWQPRVD